MATYILLAEVGFIINGEYDRSVSDVFLGVGSFNSDDEAKIEANKLLESYLNNTYEAKLYDSYAYIKEI